MDEIEIRSKKKIKSNFWMILIWNGNCNVMVMLMELECLW